MFPEEIVERSVCKSGNPVIDSLTKFIPASMFRTEWNPQPEDIPVPYIFAKCWKCGVMLNCNRRPNGNVIGAHGKTGIVEILLKTLE